MAVSSGNLAITSSLGSASVNVNSSGSLSGTGAVGVSRWPQRRGLPPDRRRRRHAPYRALSLASSSILDFNLNTPNVTPGTGGNGLIQITGGLSVGQNLTLTITPSTSFANGIYYLATYSGTLSNNSLAFNGWTVSGGTPESGHLITSSSAAAASTWRCRLRPAPP